MNGSSLFSQCLDVTTIHLLRVIHYLLIFVIYIGERDTAEHIEAETKWTPFRRRHVQVHFLE